MKFARLTETARPITRKHETDAGLDLYADLSEYDKIVVLSHHYYIVHTGVTVEIPKGFFGWITNKSGSNHLIGGGIVDEGYQGELLVKIMNVTDETLVITRESKAIAQLLILPCLVAIPEEESKDSIHLESSERGVDGGILRQVTVIDSDGNSVTSYDFPPHFGRSIPHS